MVNATAPALPTGLDGIRIWQLLKVGPLILIAIVLFASTNVNDIFMLVSFVADRRFQDRSVVIGQYAGITTLFAVSLLASLFSVVVPRPYCGFLGFIPIAIGLRRLVSLYRVRGQEEPTIEQARGPAGYGQSATVAMMTIAHGGDNIGIYTPEFAIRSGPELAVTAVVFAVMTAIWCLLAHRLANHPMLGAPVRRCGHRVVPFALVLLGVLILHEAGSLSMLLRFI